MVKLAVMKIGILLLLCSLLSGCNDFLEEMSQDEIRPSTVDDMEQLLNGEAYTRLFADYILNVTEIFTDDIECRGAVGWDAESAKITLEKGKWKFTWQKGMFDEGEGGNIVDYWELPYRKIKGCNVVLDYLDKVEGSKTRKENLRGEALTLRAFYYLMLVNLKNAFYLPKTGPEAERTQFERYFTTGKHGEICKVFSMDQHAMIPDVLVMGADVWNSIAPEDQQIILEAAYESTDSHKVAWDAAIEEAIEEAKTEMGVTFIEDVDKEAFREATADMIQEYCDRYPGVNE